MLPLLLLVCSLFTACTPAPRYIYDTPELVRINLIDQNGLSETISNRDRLGQYENVDFLEPQPYQKVLRIYNRDSLGNVPAYLTSYHPNGLLKQYLEIMNARAFGNYYEWYSDGTLKISGNVVGGECDLTTAAEHTWLFDGISSAYNEEGLLVAEIEYSKGELSGVSTYYHPNGAVWKRIGFCKDKVEGTFEIYRENGTLLQTAQFEDGERQGATLRYWEDGRVAAEESYAYGNLRDAVYYDKKGSSVAKICDGDGQRAVFGKEGIAEIQTFKGGQPEGLVKVFNKKGQIARHYSILNGLKHGEEIFFYENRTSSDLEAPKLLITWFEGKIQGTTKTWYTNGRLESQREMSQNMKNGLSTAYYRDGSLMMIEEYERDILQKGDYFKKGDKIPVSQVKEGKGIATLFDAEGTFMQKVAYNKGRPEGSE